jgi:hypothetical protein
MSLERIRESLDAAGFNVTGSLAAPDYDALVPAAWKLAEVAPRARGVLVVGHAGRALWPRFLASPEARLDADPLDRYTARALASAAGPDARWALYSERRGGAYVPLVALAQRAGLGTPGRVGVLLHPAYGPWMSLRGLIFAPARLATPDPLAFTPCDGCPAPCAQVCHGKAIGERSLDARRCYAARLTLPACKLICDARLACPVGQDHAYSPDQLAHHYRIRKH